jgi:hypothetical protein
MRNEKFSDIINHLASYTSSYEMVTDVLKMNGRNQFISLCAIANQLCDDETSSNQIMLYAKIVERDLSVFEEDEEDQMYMAVIDGTFDIIDKHDSYDIGCDHDKIHEFIVDRLDLL